MPQLIILGTSNAIPDEQHANTHMVLVCNRRTVLIDCVDQPLHRLQKAGVDHRDLTDIILTHFHPDHVSGVPQLLMNMWLLGRTRPIKIFGLSHTLDRMEKLMEFYGWKEWPDFYPVTFHHLPADGDVSIIDDEELSLAVFPVKHMIPGIGLRIEFKQRQKSLVYSGDTEPCAEVVRMARKADILIHEATGESIGHSSAKQAGGIAQEAEAGALYLIHYPTGTSTPQDLVKDAQSPFHGPVVLTSDFMVLDF